MNVIVWLITHYYPYAIHTQRIDAFIHYSRTYSFDSLIGLFNEHATNIENGEETERTDRDESEGENTRGHTINKIDV